LGQKPKTNRANNPNFYEKVIKTHKNIKKVKDLTEHDLKG